MSGYRDDQEAQRMRVASLEERLAELEAENEELRVREAEAETPLVVDAATHEPASPPAAPRLSKDVAETLASLKAMGADLILSEAEKALEEAATRERIPTDPALLNLAKMAAKSARPATSQAPQVDTVPLVSLAQLKRPPDADLREDQAATSDAYWSGVGHGIFASVLFIACLVIAVLTSRP